jgi:hypothetical protein
MRPVFCDVLVDGVSSRGVDVSRAMGVTTTFTSLHSQRRMSRYITRTITTTPSNTRVANEMNVIAYPTLLSSCSLAPFGLSC